jgi:Zn-dependent peptidase ImmA (M78 family)
MLGRQSPIDPVRIAKSLGVKVLDVYLKRDVSGALMKKQEEDPSILLNAEDSTTRKRFTCAHELGHYIRRAGERNQYEYVDYRDQRSSTGTVEEEKYANSFAASLLMPELAVKAFHAEGPPEFRIAKRFGVSPEAMQYRLENLGLLVSEETLERAVQLDGLDPHDHVALVGLDHWQDIQLKRTYAKWLLILVAAQRLIADAVFVAYAWAGEDWPLETRCSPSLACIDARRVDQGPMCELHHPAETGWLARIALGWLDSARRPPAPDLEEKR